MSRKRYTPEFRNVDPFKLSGCYYSLMDSIPDKSNKSVRGICAIRSDRLDDRRTGERGTAAASTFA